MNNFSIIDMANYINYKKCELDKTQVRNLCFLAYAFYLVEHDKEIVEGLAFEAWPHGPVNVELDNYFNEHIVSQDDKLSLNIRISLIHQSLNKIPEDIKDYLDEIIDYFGKLDKYSLESYVMKTLPFSLTRVGYGDFEKCNKVINKDLIEDYYAIIMKHTNGCYNN